MSEWRHCVAGSVSGTGIWSSFWRISHASGTGFVLPAVSGAGVMQPEGRWFTQRAGFSMLSWVPVTVAALPNKSEMWQKTWRGCYWVYAYLYLLWSQDTLISAKSLKWIFWKQNWTGAKTLGDALLLQPWPHTLHQELSLPGKNNRDHCVFSSQGGLQRKAPGHGVAALWRWGERKWFPEQVSVTWLPQKVFSGFSLISVQECGKEEGWVCLVKVLHSGSGFKGGTGRMLMKW